MEKISTYNDHIAVKNVKKTVNSVDVTISNQMSKVMFYITVIAITVGITTDVAFKFFSVFDFVRQRRSFVNHVYALSFFMDL